MVAVIFITLEVIISHASLPDQCGERVARDYLVVIICQNDGADGHLDSSEQ